LEEIVKTRDGSAVSSNVIDQILKDDEKAGQGGWGPLWPPTASVDALKLLIFGIGG
jgi:hypothetical protein